MAGSSSSPIRWRNSVRVTIAAELWRRAPLWRGTLLLAAAATALALAYPTGLPGRAADAPSGHYAPVPAPVDPFPLAPRERDILAFGGGQVPLPRGDWHKIVGFHTTDAMPEVNGLVLLRLVGKRVAGAVVVHGTTMREIPFGTPAPPWNCNQPQHYVNTDAGSADAARQDCWFLGPASLPGLWRGDPNTQAQPLRMFISAATAVQQAGATLPPIAMSAGYFLADGKRWMQILYYEEPTIIDDAPRQPDWAKSRVDADPAKAAYVERSKLWASQWADLVRRGFAGQLTTQDVSPDLAAAWR